MGPGLEERGACYGNSIDVRPQASARSVQGFGYPGLMDYPVKITGINNVTVAFGGSSPANQVISNWSITGSIDRVAGLPARTQGLRTR